MSKTPQDPKSYENLINLQSVHSAAHARMTEIEAELKAKWLETVDSYRKEYGQLQESIVTSEESIEHIATIHPEWFEKSRNLKTPYGTVQFRRTTKLEVANEEVSIALLEQIGEEGLPFLIPSKKLNLEALEKMEDEELARIKIKRVITDNCTVKPAKIDLGKATKAAAKVAKEGGES